MQVYYVHMLTCMNSEDLVITSLCHGVLFSLTYSVSLFWKHFLCGYSKGNTCVVMYVVMYAVPPDVVPPSE